MRACSNEAATKAVHGKSEDHRLVHPGHAAEQGVAKRSPQRNDCRIGDSKGAMTPTPAPADIAESVDFI
jgi:hypothetical protein